MIPARASAPPLLRAEPISGFALILVAGLAFAGLCVAANVALESGLSWRCPVMTVFHVPCPSCGSTRAFAALSEFRLWDAIRFNPLLVSAIPLGTSGFLGRRFLNRYSRFGWPLLAAAVTGNWVYLYLFLPR